MKFGHKYRLVLVTFSASMSSFIIGNILGWTSPMIPRLRLQTDDSPIDRPITLPEEGWLSSLLFVGAIIGSLFNGFIVSLVGRKWNLLMHAFLIIIGYVLYIFGHSLEILYTARTMHGIFVGCLLSTLPMYTSEISTDDCRGALGTIVVLFETIGILFAFCISPYLSYTNFQICGIGVCVVFIGSFIFMPETPYYHAIRGRTEDGVNALIFLRKLSRIAAEEEMRRIKAIVEDDYNRNNSFKNILSDRANQKALVICSSLMMLMPLTGAPVITINTQTIFMNAHTTIDPAKLALILPSVQIFANLFAASVVDRFGRKPILILSTLGMTVCLFILGVFFYIQQNFDSSSWLWIPLAAIVLFKMIFSMGFGPVAWVIIGEMFNSNIRHYTVCFETMLCFLCAFIATRWFPELSAIGLHYNFWMFSTFCFIAFLFVKFVIIETKGLSLEKIQENLRGSK